MEFEEVVFSRQSVRNYTDTLVSKRCLEYICKVGFTAPSANNTRPWECIIIQNKKVLSEISKMKPQWYMLKNVAAAILLIGKEDKYFQQNCGAAAQNMLLAATDKHLGSVWLGLYPNKELVEKIHNKFMLPKGILPFCIIGIGYPKEYKKKSIFNDDNRIHYEIY